MEIEAYGYIHWLTILHGGVLVMGEMMTMMMMMMMMMERKKWVVSAHYVSCEMG